MNTRYIAKNAPDSSGRQKQQHTTNAPPPSAAPPVTSGQFAGLGPSSHHRRRRFPQQSGGKTNSSSHHRRSTLPSHGNHAAAATTGNRELKQTPPPRQQDRRHTYNKQRQEDDTRPPEQSHRLKGSRDDSLRFEHFAEHPGTRTATQQQSPAELGHASYGDSRSFERSQPENARQVDMERGHASCNSSLTFEQSDERPVAKAKQKPRRGSNNRNSHTFEHFAEHPGAPRGAVASGHPHHPRESYHRRPGPPFVSKSSPSATHAQRNHDSAANGFVQQREDSWTTNPTDLGVQSSYASSLSSNNDNIDDDNDTHATGRCTTLDLEWLLKLNDKRKGDAAHKRGSKLFSSSQSHLHGTPPPSSDSFTPHRPTRSVLEENEIVSNLLKQGFTGGLARTLIQNVDKFSVRIWLVNNSGSMNTNDGHLVVQSPKPPYRFENINCTRWEEVQSCVAWHAEFSSVLEVPMAIRFLNDPGVTVGPQQLGVAASSHKNVQEEMTRLKQVLAKSHPDGTCPLNVHLRDVVDSVVQMASRLRQRKEMVAIVIVTDGLPTDADGVEGDEVNEEFMSMLRLLQGMPVWVVIRLSTDDERVVAFYNDIDEHMVGVVAGGGDDNSSGAMATAGQNVHLDVLDDFVSEAQEVYQFNPWLNYALPLHLCRESGVSFPAFDALDNRALTPSELAEFVQLLFDSHCYAKPVLDYPNFRKEVEAMVKSERNLFNPIKKKFLPWIDMKELDKRYGPPGTKAATCNCTIQ